MKYCNQNEDEFKQPAAVKEASSQLFEHFNKLHISSTVASRSKTAKNKNLQQHQKSDTTSRQNPAKETQTGNQLTKVSKNVRPESKGDASGTPRSVRTQTDDKENVDAVEKFRSGQPTPIENSSSKRSYFVSFVHSIKVSFLCFVAEKHSIYSSNTQHRYIRNTPTDLYQYYQQNWDKFKKNTPGENSHSNIRLAIRKRMEHIQKPQSKSKVYLSMDGIDNHKIFKRM